MSFQWVGLVWSPAENGWAALDYRGKYTRRIIDEPRLSALNFQDWEVVPTTQLQLEAKRQKPNEG